MAILNRACGLTDRSRRIGQTGSAGDITVVVRLEQLDVDKFRLPDNAIQPLCRSMKSTKVANPAVRRPPLWPGALQYATRAHGPPATRARAPFWTGGTGRTFPAQHRPRV